MPGKAGKGTVANGSFGDGRKENRGSAVRKRYTFEEKQKVLDELDNGIRASSSRNNYK